MTVLVVLATACGDEPEPAANNGDKPNVPDVETELEKDAQWWVQSERLYTTLAAGGADGNVYFGAWDGKLYALGADGEEKWTVETGDKIDAAPAVADDGTVIAGSWDKKIYAINGDGSEKWTFEADSLIDVSPSIDADGRVYVASDAGTLYRLEADGTVDWEIELPGAAVTSASIFDGPAGLAVFVGTADQAVHCISDGQIQASASISGHPIDDIALDATGAAYVGTSSGRMTKINSDCTVAFEINQTYAQLTSPTLDVDGFMYAGSHSEQIYQISGDDGTEQWSTATGRRAPLLSAPTVSDDGKLYAGANGLISITVDGDVEKVSDLDVLTSPLLVGGAVFTSTESGYFVRLDFNLGELADSDWPIQHGNAQRTGYLAP